MLCKQVGLCEKGFHAFMWLSSPPVAGILRKVSKKGNKSMRRRRKKRGSPVRRTDSAVRRICGVVWCGTQTAQQNSRIPQKIRIRKFRGLRTYELKAVFGGVFLTRAIHILFIRRSFFTKRDQRMKNKKIFSKKFLTLQAKFRKN